MPKKFPRHPTEAALEGELGALWEQIDLLIKREQRLRDAMPGIPGSTAGASHKHLQADITDLDHDDADAIHDNVAGEIAAVTEKESAVDADLVLIEDSAESNNKKRIRVGNLIRRREVRHTLYAGPGLAF